MHEGERSHPNVTLAVLSIAGLAYAMLSSAVVPALPTIQHDLHTSENGVAWLLTAYLLSASVGTAIIGRLGDMYGKEHLLVWTLVVLSAGTLLAGVSGSLALLIVARTIQGVGGGIFPLAFGIIRDEFPRERVAGSIGLMSALLGIGGGVGILAGAAIVEHLSWHWLFWLPLVLIVAAAVCTWRFVPESPVRVPGRINWPAAVLMSGGMTLVLIAVSETTTWGWGGTKTVGLLVVGAVLCVAWVVVELRSSQPLIDMTLMRVRAVWTANLAAFLLGAGMYASFVVFPQFAQLPKSTGFGFGASVVGSALYLLPSTVGMFVVGFAAGPIAARFGSKAALVAGSIFTAVSFGYLAAQHDHVYDMLLSSTLLGIGIGLAFAALGNIVVQAVDDHQTGVASGMNTVMRTVGGALGGQLTATFLADHVRGGYPTVTGFTDSFVLSTCFLVVCAAAALLVPGRHSTQYVDHFEEAAATE
ncbi:MAG TPA: MFS transporter [Gaiellaceae bacterium]|nr:MFS transporter [Gaiellaceae bacterium]